MTGAHATSILYADNIAINQGEQPVHFVPDEDLQLTNANGMDVLIRIVDIAGTAILVEYRPLR